MVQAAMVKHSRPRNESRVTWPGPAQAAYLFCCHCTDLVTVDLLQCLRSLKAQYVYCTHVVDYY